MVTLEAREIAMEGIEEAAFRPAPKLRLPEGGVLRELTPRPEMIDLNGHMNNASYLDAAEELLPEPFAGREIRAVAIDYEHELLPGQRAQVRVVPEADACSFEGSTDGKCCFRLRIDYR